MDKEGTTGSTDGRKTLLLVDPDPLLRWSVETHLLQWFDVSVAANPKDALLSVQKTRHDGLIISAELGADMETIEEETRQKNPDVQIVRLTTANEPAATDGSVVSLEKPFRLEALSQILGVGTPNSGDGRHVR